MAPILKVVAAVALALAALWAPSTTPVTPSPVPPFWGGDAAGAAGLADTLSTDAAIGQIVAAAVGARGLNTLVAQGRVGRVEVLPSDTDSYLARLRTWQRDAPIPVAVSTPGWALPAAVRLPSAAALGASGRPDLAYATGMAAAQTARTLGVQMPGSPVGGAGAFGPTPGSDVEQAVVRGLRAGGVLPTARLSGPAALDVLHALAPSGLMEVRLPVRSDLDAAVVRAVGSSAVYAGLVVAEVDGRATGAVAAVGAGADVVHSTAPGVVFDSLRAAVRSGRLSKARVRAASERALAAKAWAGLSLAPSRPGPEAGPPALRIASGRAPSPDFLGRVRLLSGEVARRAATVVQDADGPLPLVGAAAPPSLYTVLLTPDADADQGSHFTDALADALRPEVRTTFTRLGLGLDAVHYSDAVDAARDADLVVLAAFPDDGRLAARHRELAETVLASNRAVVLVVFGDPGVAAGLGRPEALVAVYGGAPDHQAAAAAAIAGQIEIDGALPTGVAGLAAQGEGVQYRQQRLRPGTAQEAGLRPGVAERVDAVMDRAVASGAFPGGAVAIGRDGVLVRLAGYGRLSRSGADVTPETVYDLASLTKVVGTTAVAMQLVEAGELDLDARVSAYLPAYRGLGKEAVTVRQLLEHSAGHRPWYPFHAQGALDRRDVLDFIYADTLRYPPGARSRYSDFDMILLGEVLERVTGQPLEQAFRDRVFGPLGMTRTGFRRAGAVDRAVAPTEADRAWRGRLLQGEVHDEAASVMGGTAGHAGLFSTAADLSRFAFALSEGGSAYGARLFRRTTLDRFTRRVRLRSTYPTGLGWMMAQGNTAAGDHFGPRAFGHTGYTGTSMWIDPDDGTFVVLLTNRVHPTRRNRQIREVRPAVADAVAGAVAAPPGRAHTAWGFGPIPDDLASR